MLYISKRKIEEQDSSTTEKAVSILGFILAVGLLGGLSALIYGLVQGNNSGKIGGAIVFSISALFSIILALVFIYCLKNNNVNSNSDEEQGRSTHQRRDQERNHQQRHNRQMRQERNSSREITMISGIHKFENSSQHPQINGSDVRKYSPPMPSIGLTESMNSLSGKQVVQSPLKNTSFTMISSSNNLINQQTNTLNDSKRNNYNKY